MRKPWVIAHRGASGHTPENTLAAFERAVELGAGFIETDIHLTRDARFVAIHDDTLERTTNGRGAVPDLCLELKYEAAWGMQHALAAALQNPEIAARTIVLSFNPAMLFSLRQLDAS